MNYLGLLYCILGFVIVVQVIRSVLKANFNSRLFINLGVLCYYCIPFAQLCFASELDYRSRYGDIRPTYLAFLMVLLFYLFFLFGQSAAKWHWGEHKKEKYEYYLNNEVNVVKLFAGAILIFSVIAFICYCALFGGVITVLKNITNIRGSIITSSNPKLEFIVKLYNCVIYAPVLLYPYCMSKSLGNERKINKGYFWLSFFVALIIRISGGSRAAILIYFLIFILANAAQKSVRTRRKTSGKMKWIITGAIVFVFAVIVYRPLLVAVNSISEKGFSVAMKTLGTQLFSDNGSKYSLYSIKNVVQGIIRSLEHYSVSLETAIDVVNTGVHKKNYFMEVVIMLQSVIPSALLNISKLKGLTYYNSGYIMHVFGEYQIPIGIVASAYYSGSYIWVMLYGFVVGVIGKKIDVYYCRLKKNVGYATYLYISILFLYFNFAISGDLSSQFSKGLTSFIFLWLLHKKLTKRHSDIMERGHEATVTKI